MSKSDLIVLINNQSIDYIDYIDYLNNEKIESIQSNLNINSSDL
jgi:hypothetical protein